MCTLKCVHAFCVWCRCAWTPTWWVDVESPVSYDMLRGVFTPQPCDFAHAYQIQFKSCWPVENKMTSLLRTIIHMYCIYIYHGKPVQLLKADLFCMSYICIPLTPNLPAPSNHQRRSILRKPTFGWSSYCYFRWDWWVVWDWKVKQSQDLCSQN